MNLKYQKDLAPLDVSTGSVGAYLGSGDGTVEGEKLRGAVKWDLFEKQGIPACDANFNGIIETEDNAQIRFSVLGLFLRGETDSKWRMAAGVLFETEAESYRWLNSVLGSWEGEFHMESYSHSYTVYGDSAA